MLKIIFLSTLPFLLGGRGSISCVVQRVKVGGASNRNTWALECSFVRRPGELMTPFVSLSRAVQPGNLTCLKWYYKCGTFREKEEWNGMRPETAPAASRLPEATRELPDMMSAKYSDFLTPSPLSAFWSDLTHNLPYYASSSMTPFPPPMQTSYLEAPLASVRVQGLNGQCVLHA